MRINKDEYEEYQNLKKWAKREGVLRSAKDITRLEDDIDLPIKNCVGMFALLGCKPMYSCCGFDYDGQPIHKSHQYGRPYFILGSGKRTTQIAFDFSQIKSNWFFRPGQNGTAILELHAGMNPYWRKEDCIHFAEECSSNIGWLEKTLWLGEPSMADCIELIDTNSIVKKHIKFWQYPPKESWLVYKSEVYQKLHES